MSCCDLNESRIEILNEIKRLSGASEVSTLIDEVQAAAIVGSTPAALRQRRCRGSSVLPFVKIGKNVRYPLEGVLQAIKIC